MKVEATRHFVDSGASRFVPWGTGTGPWIGTLPYDRLDAAFIAGSPAMPGIVEGGQFKAYEAAFSYTDPSLGVLRQWHARTQAMVAQERSRHRSDIIAELTGTWCFLAEPWSDVFWHWMCEGLVKIACFEAAGFEGGYVVPGGVGFVRQSLDILGIDPSRIYYCETPYAHIERLIIPRQFRTQIELRYHVGAIDWLRQRCIPDYRMDPEFKLYIARRGIRAIYNEADLLTLLSRHGFRTVYMEDLNLRDQIALSSRARILLGPHGSGFAHTIFMPRRAHVVELFSPEYVNPFTSTIVRHLQQDYSMIVGFTALLPETSRDSSIAANLDLISLALERADALERSQHGPAQSAR